MEGSFGKSSATVASIEYDPNRTSRLALLHYADGEKRYILAPVDLRVGDTLMSGPEAEIRAGNCLPLSMRWGDFLWTGDSPWSVARAAGVGC